MKYSGEIETPHKSNIQNTRTPCGIFKEQIIIHLMTQQTLVLTNVITAIKIHFIKINSKIMKLPEKVKVNIINKNLSKYT